MTATSSMPSLNGGETFGAAASERSNALLRRARELTARGRGHRPLPRARLPSSHSPSPSARGGQAHPLRSHRMRSSRDSGAQQVGSTEAEEKDSPRGDPGMAKPVVTFAETVDIARERGLCLYSSVLGPFYRIVVRDGSKDGEILGLTTGFVAPWFGLMHLDTLQIFNSKYSPGPNLQHGAGVFRLRAQLFNGVHSLYTHTDWYEWRRMKKGSSTRQRAWGSPRGLGLLIGCATFAYGYEAGCKKAELLAINDDADWAKRLVRYYSHFGFEVRYEVGERGLADVPDMLVWGGAGTRMDAEVEPMLRRWSTSIRRAKGQYAGGE